MEEVAQALRCRGLSADDAQLRTTIDSLRLSMPLDYADVHKLSKKLNDCGFLQGAMTVPIALRGMKLCQLEQLCTTLVDSGWLEDTCNHFNMTNQVEIKDGQAIPMKTDLYALNRFFISPVTATDPILRGNLKPTLVSDLSIPVPPVACSYSQLLNPRGMTIQIFISHYWGHEFRRTVDALTNYISRHVADGDTRPDQITVWVCAFALNQHNIEDELGSSIETAPFNAAIAKASHGVAMIIDLEVEPLKRIWCLYELARADELGKAFVLVDDVGARGSCRKSCLYEKDTAELADKLSNLSAFDASSSRTNDKLMIWFKIMDAWFSCFSDFEAHYLTEFSRFKLGPFNFSRFDTLVRGLLATPLLAAALEVGNTRAALLYVGMGATCDVSQLNDLLDHGIDLRSKVTHVFRGTRGQASLTFIMAGAGRSEELRFLLARGAPVDDTFDASDASRFSYIGGSRALLAAVMNGHVDCVSILLKHKADCDATGVGGHTPLHFCGAASGSGKTVIAALLLDARADVRARATAGEMVIHTVSCFEETDAIIELMLDRKSCVNDVDNEGATPLHVAATWGRIGPLAVLLDRKADTGARKMDGSTPLHRAAANDRLSAAALLLTHQADRTIPNNDGLTPEQLAALRNNSEMCELIRAHLG
eukprot:TRINITY_DN24817_c0_g1_i1.p1 TRINITY_DN24817_c0_g1~~TRINITY_DN24817_c0_g1_i1.p1  ORF type:complete len:702 (-),score=86.59 TRINITY_DN24817_c0_g1_i1:141-2093(-)